jgi:dienelactone hydrolase
MWRGCALRMTLIEPHMMTLQRGAHKVSGFLALPRDPGRYRALFAMHEWWGLNDWVKEQAINLAANGYVAFAVDLYQTAGGGGTRDAEIPHHDRHRFQRMACFNGCREKDDHRRRPSFMILLRWRSMKG